MSTSVWSGAGQRIYMQEVGTRDGLQNEAIFVPTEEKIRLVNALSTSGLAKIEVTAFVDRKSTRLNSSHSGESRMPSSA